jgi:hypothetical protein
MAELQTSETVEPSVQEQAAVDSTESMAQAWDDNQEQLAQQLGQQEDTPQPDRPEWLPEKFSSAEDMAAAYQALESKLGNPEAAPEPEGEQPESVSAINAATDEFMESGQLSDETIDALEISGLPKQLVESYLAGQQAIDDTQANEVFGAVGGQEGYQAMAEWATENLDEGSLDAFNQIVETGTVEQAKVAAQGLYSQFRAASGGAPQLVQGQTNGQAVVPFTSSAMVTKAMSDPRYKQDPGYQAEVHRRLSVSDIL